MRENDVFYKVNHQYSCKFHGCPHTIQYKMRVIRDVNSLGTYSACTGLILSDNHRDVCVQYGSQ